MAESKENEPRRGFLTTEFWLSAIAEIVGLLILSGAVVEGTTISKIVGGAVAVLAALGYTASRSRVKKGQ